MSDTSYILHWRLHYENSEDIPDEGNIRPIIHMNEGEGSYPYGVWAWSVHYGEPGKAARAVNTI